MVNVDRHVADRFWVGLVAGLIGTCCGGLLLGVWWSMANGSTVAYFYDEVVLGSMLYRDSILTASTLFNVLLFWLANRMDWERMAQGLLAVILTTVPVIVYLQATAGTSW